MADEQLNLSHSDILGVVQRGLRELDAYLNRAPASINFAAASQHLLRMNGFLENLQTAHVGAQNGASAESRAN